MTDTSAVVDAFLAKLDAFAAGLDPHEQAVLVELLAGDDDEVSGFGQPPAWPGAGILIPDFRVASLTAQIDGFLSSGHSFSASGTGNFHKSGGGSDT